MRVFDTDAKGRCQVYIFSDDNNFWMSEEELSRFFNIEVSEVQKYINKILEEKELDNIEESLTCVNFKQDEVIDEEDPNDNSPYYNLSMFYALAYRIKSKNAVKFRNWATDVVKDYSTKGYSLNEFALEKQKEQINNLKGAISLFERGLENQIQDLEQAKNLSKLIKDFAEGLTLLDDFDHRTLDTCGLTVKEVIIVPKEEFIDIINGMKKEFESDVFAVPKDASFESSVYQIYQTCGGGDCYPTIEEKAAMLLYLIVKNHSFSDGNKRIGAGCFLYFLDKNNMLYDDFGDRIIDSGTLFALTLLIAESNPNEMETIKQIIISVLNRKVCNYHNC